ncbi:hypothetical protein GCM10023169_28730 [Georgenia halophila]|uniref:Glycoside hydrolase family 65 n=2 Tax=Georgenia halophila TaxID=620889 RepID=A0ABP8LFQ6_9MICO
MQPAGRLDREAIVRRHAVVSDTIDPRSPVQVGNGTLAFAVDVTGLQTFPDAYPVPDASGGPAGTLLGTQAQWGWHSSPPPDGREPELRRRPYRTRRGQVPYVDAEPSGKDDSTLDEESRWLRANPHRLDLLRMGLVVDGTSPPREDLGPCRQVLDLWTGTVTSELALAGERLRVTTACHPERDVLAVRVERLDAGRPGDGPRLGVRLAFPYGSESWTNAADWGRSRDHRTEVHSPGAGGSAATVRRYFDSAPEPLYTVAVGAPEVLSDGDHQLLALGGTTLDRALDLVVELVPGGTAPAGPPLSVDEVLDAARRHWPAFWRSGAALDLSATTDPRAAELERRAVLSQYLTAVQCSGDLPPQETGLLTNSWRGRFHLEMHYWHAAHFALWGRPALLARSMEFYRRILPVARDTARLQGYDGARWPKQVGPDGRESPSHIGPFLLWQQPHVIHLAELLRRAGDEGAAERYGEIVDATARFMADVAEPTENGYALGPPLIPAQESYADLRDRVTNPPFELAYWSWALQVAQQWRIRAGLSPERLWDEVSNGMARPLVRDGRYAAIGVEPYTIREDHPSMVYGLGVVPATDLLDPRVVRTTLHSILEDWDWPSTWGWDFPALAMTAARLGEPSTAVDALLLEVPKNTYLPNGHNHQTDVLPAYLPGNGGLLAALALMTGGWDTGPATGAQGFPDDWVVRHEGFTPSP